MSISRRSIDMLMDLIENRIACMQVVDREDHRQLAILTQARREIMTMSSTTPTAKRETAPRDDGAPDSIRPLA